MEPPKILNLILLLQRRARGAAVLAEMLRAQVVRQECEIGEVRRELEARGAAPAPQGTPIEQRQIKV